MNYTEFQSSGTNGAALGEFNEAMHLAANSYALYVADTGNNRVQIFKHVEGGKMEGRGVLSPLVGIKIAHAARVA